MSDDPTRRMPPAGDDDVEPTRDPGAGGALSSGKSPAPIVYAVAALVVLLLIAVLLMRGGGAEDEVSLESPDATATTSTEAAEATAPEAGGEGAGFEEPDQAQTAPALPGQPPPGAQGETQPPQDVAPTAGEGDLLAGGEPMLPLPNDNDLGRFEGYDVEGRQLTVLSVVDGGGFWVGYDEFQRVFVRMTGGDGATAGGTGSATPAASPEATGASPGATDGTAGGAVDVQPGDMVDLTGTVVLNPESLEELGVTDERDLELLQQQRAHVEATSVERR